nr:MAG TPA: hypothetical protein [Caudoviricetes sp.]
MKRRYKCKSYFSFQRYDKAGYTVTSTCNICLGNIYTYFNYTVCIILVCITNFDIRLKQSIQLLHRLFDFLQRSEYICVMYYILYCILIYSI